MPAHRPLSPVSRLPSSRPTLAARPAVFHSADSPPSPSASEKRYSRLNISLFRSASGAEQTLPSTPPTDPDPDPDHVLNYKPRISSVTDSSGSPDRTRQKLDLSLDKVPLPTDHLDVDHDHDDDCGSTYSHASAINLDDLDDDDVAGLRVAAIAGINNPDVVKPPTLNRQMLEYNRQSFANSFAKARQAKISRQVVLAPKELQPHNRAASLVERCVRAFSEALDMNLSYARVAAEKFYSFAPLFTKDERLVIGDFLKESATRLRNETPTPWRSPIQWPHKRSIVRPGQLQPPTPPTKELAAAISAPWKRRNAKALTNDTLVRSVVFGSHVIPGVQSAESLLLRMAGEYQREEVNRKANRAERIDIPLSFAMTLTGALATFARLECSASYRRHRSRSAANRRSNPQALIMIKTKYDGVKLSFAVTLHGDSPCTVLFRRPRIFSQRKIDDYATLVTEAKDILSEFGREVAGPKD